jgi:hypothetical protein
VRAGAPPPTAPAPARGRRDRPPGHARGQALVQAVHDQHDRTAELVVEPAVEGAVVPFVRRLALGLRQRLLGLQRVVDDDQVGTPPGQHPADRGGDARALRGGLEFRHRLPGPRFDQRSRDA